MTRTTFYLIRHGESESNRRRVFTGWKNFPLTDLGVTQAKLVASALPRVDVIYSSDLDRAVMTARQISNRFSIPVLLSKNLREINAGAWEGLSYDKLVERYPDTYGTWVEDIGHACPDDGESVAEMGDRVLSALRELADRYPGKKICVVTHATPIRAIRCMAETGSVDGLSEIPWATNASITVCEFGEGKMHVKTYGMDTHLGKLKTNLVGNV